jgi:hypothetical protein
MNNLTCIRCGKGQLYAQVTPTRTVYIGALVGHLGLIAPLSSGGYIRARCDNCAAHFRFDPNRPLADQQQSSYRSDKFWGSFIVLAITVWGLYALVTSYIQH